MAAAIVTACAAGLLVFVLLGVFVWKHVRAFDRNMDALIDGILDDLPEGSTDREKFDALQRRVREARVPHRQNRINSALKGSLVLAAIISSLWFCVTIVFAEPGYRLAALSGIALLAGAGLGAVAFFRESRHCGVLASNSASNPKTWLAMMLPSVPVAGHLDIALGSMNPELISEEWFLTALTWLKEKRGASVRVVSALPERSRMDDAQRTSWEILRGKLIRKGLHHDLRILPERVLPQFAVSDRVVRIERDHDSWLDRDPGYRVSNHAHVLDYPLIRKFRVRFAELWTRAIPAANLPAFSAGEG